MAAKLEPDAGHPARSSGKLTSLYETSNRRDVWRDRKVLVTGGAGFIGSHLTERLVELGANVTALDHRPVVEMKNLARVRDHIEMQDLDLVSGDVEALLSSGKFAVIFHLAAGAQVEASIEHPKSDLERNAVATLNLLEAVRRTAPQGTVLYTSSAVVYAGGGKELISENDPTGPTTPYGVSKLAAERYVAVYSRLFSIKTAILRLFSVYGPRLRKQIVFDLMCRLHADPKRLPLQGDGTQVRDFSYVSDVVRALILVAEKAPLRGEAYNVASGQHTTTKALAKQIAHSMGADPALAFTGVSHSGDTQHWFADTTRLRELGYRPSTPLEEGLQETADWFRTEAIAEGRKDT